VGCTYAENFLRNSTGLGTQIRQLDSVTHARRASILAKTFKQVRIWNHEFVERV